MGVRRRRRLGEAGWRGILDRFAGSGLGVGAFCRREGVSAASFYRWRHLLEGNGTNLGRSNPVAVAWDTRDGGDRSPPASGPPAFVDLGSLVGASAGGRLELRIELGAGVVLHLARG